VFCPPVLVAAGSRIRALAGNPDWLYWCGAPGYDVATAVTLLLEITSPKAELFSALVVF